MLVRRLGVWNVALAAIAAAALIVEGQLRATGGLSPGAYVLALVAAAPLVWRTRAPLTALVGVELGAVTCALAFHGTWAATGMVVVVLYTVARCGNRLRSLAVGAGTSVAVIAVIALIDGKVELPGALARVTLVFAALALGDTIRSRHDLRVAARELAERAERDREEESRRRAVQERLRIARELHDTLAHSLVAINVRAGVALDIDEHQDRSGALRDIKQVSATALRDLRSTLSVLREQGDAAPLAPSSDLEALPALLDQARSAGLRAALDLQVDGAAVSSAIGGAVFRIVQEGLTNVLRHADATSAHVTVRAGSDTVDIDITDDGRSDSAGVSPGLGMRGMAERAEALGGRLEAGPRGEGGWSVHAQLPLAGGDRE